MMIGILLPVYGPTLILLAVWFQKHMQPNAGVQLLKVWLLMLAALALLGAILWSGFFISCFGIVAMLTFPTIPSGLVLVSTVERPDSKWIAVASAVLLPLLGGAVCWLVLVFGNHFTGEGF